ncbi:ABC transporter permease [Lutibacter sp. B1]|uniref:ABC transporter permease n=1 Tax=Lutibacter sp. B1 TaxID=2725996 RepID=UPI00145670C8|nr:ABC transporter permease [Lutibacter sp. B1]NLP56890.1 FtsX-like permease family protein [Lutibacter sp. B1]
MLRFNLKLAIRNLLKNKVYSTLIIGSFAIGFTAIILIGLFYNAENTINTGFLNYKNSYRLYDEKKNTCNLDYKLNAPLADKYPEIETTCPVEYMTGYEITIKDKNSKAYTQIDNMIVTSNNFFELFSVDVIASLSEKPFNSLNSLVITESVAKRIYKDQNPLGRTLEHDFFTGTISAVIKDLPKNSSFKAEILLNSKNENYQMSNYCNDGICYYPTNHFLLLKNGINAQQFALKLNTSLKQYNTNFDNLALQPIADIYLSKLSLQDSHTKGNSKMLVIFLSIGILILLLSSINYLNYTVSMQYAKLKEIGINKINGASKRQLITYSFIEITLGILLSLLISICLTVILLPYTEMFFGRNISFSEIHIFQLIPVFSGIIIGVILLNGLAPMYVLSRFNIIDFLTKGRKHKRKQTGIKPLLTFQLVVSISLIAMVILIFKQIQFVKNYNLGFDKEHLIKIELPYSYTNPSIIKGEMEKLAFVKESALSDGYPGRIKLFIGSDIKENNFDVNCIHVSDDYIKTMGIDLLEGRNFLSGDKNKACLLNEEAIKLYGWDTIKNKKFHEQYQVIGIINNFNVQSLHASLNTVALIYDPDHIFNTISLKLTEGNVNNQLKQIEQTWKRLLPNEPLNFDFYDSLFQSMYAKEEKLAQSITFFSLIAIVLTCMGILSQIFLISLNKTKEIGIRKVNGAKISEVIAMLNKDFFKWIFTAFLIATPIAYFAMQKWLENFAYKTNISWWIFVMAGFSILIIALLTVSWQSYRAATKNPVDALRNE